MALGDKACDADWPRSELDERGAVAVIPAKSNRKRQIDSDFHACRWRHLVENIFCNLKAFRRIATYEKTDQSYRARINLAALKAAPRSMSTGPRVCGDLADAGLRTAAFRSSVLTSFRTLRSGSLKSAILAPA